jgi:hypothetical protein
LQPHWPNDTLVQARLFLLSTVVAALVWFAIMVLLRSRYLNLLVRGPSAAY